MELIQPLRVYWQTIAPAIVFLLVFLLCCYPLIPPRHPRKIPAVPFWVTLLPLFKTVDQQETFRKYIAEPLYTHGAVKIFFAGRWNVIIQRPAYLSEVFKKEHVYQKSGNHEKIPQSVLAEFLGQRIYACSLFNAH